MSNCNEATENLYSYLDQELDDATAAAVRDHLEACGGCCDGFDFERRLKQIVHDHLSEEMPSGLVDRVRDLIQQERTGAGR